MSQNKKFKSSYLMLTLLTVFAAFLMLKSSDETIFAFSEGSYFHLLFENFDKGNTIIFNLSVGFLVSIIFYLLVVYLPQKKRKELLRENFKKQYKYFKEDTISILLSATKVSYDSQLPRKLSDQAEFRAYFKESVSESQNRWHTVLNGLDEVHLKDLSVELTIFMEEVSYVLNNVAIDDEKVHFFFRNLTHMVYKSKNLTLEYDEVKQLSSFLWNIFAGWDWKDGYRNVDIIERMIIKI